MKKNGVVATEEGTDTIIKYSVYLRRKQQFQDLIRFIIMKGKKMIITYSSSQIRQKLLKLAEDYHRKTGSTFINKAEIRQLFNCLSYQLRNEKSDGLLPNFSSRGIDRSSLRKYEGIITANIFHHFDVSDDIIDDDKIEVVLEEIRDNIIDYWTEKERSDFEDVIVGSAFHNTDIDLVTREGIDALCLHIRQALINNS